MMKGNKEDNKMEELTNKMIQFFSGEDFIEHGDNARLELSPAELRKISSLMTENTKLKQKLEFIENFHYPKFRNQQEKHRVIHIVSAIEKCLTLIGNDDSIDDISVLKQLVREIEVMKEQEE